MTTRPQPREISITQARERLTQLPEEMSESHSTYAVTKRGVPVMALMPWELFEAIEETLEIMTDPELMDALRQGIQEAKEGLVTPWEEVKADLGLETLDEGMENG